MPEPANPIRIVIVDDHPAVRRGLSTLLSGQPDFVILGAAEDGDRGIAMALEARPDIVLMDYSMPGISGAEASARLREKAPEIRVVFLTSFSERAVMKEAFTSGAVYYILKDAPPDQLIEGIRIAAANIGRVDA